MSNSNSGIIKKLRSQLNGEVQYNLPIGSDFVNLNPLIGHNIKVSFLDEFFCIKCNNKIKKTFAQGYCFPCFRDIPETSECILRPQLCQAQNGIARDIEWAKKYCLQRSDTYV